MIHVMLKDFGQRPIGRA